MSGFEACCRASGKGPLRREARGRAKSILPALIGRVGLMALALVLWALPVLPSGVAMAQTGSGTAAPTADPWPKQRQVDGATITVYEPQVDSWDGGFLKLRAAVALKPADGGQEVFGIVHASAHTIVDKSTRMVTLFNFSLLQIDFPTLPDHGQKYFAGLGQFLPTGTKQIALDRLQSFLSVEKLSAQTVEVKNDPPQIIISYKPAVLVPVHGEAVIHDVAGTPYQRVINTGALLLKVPDGAFYLHVYDGWMTSPQLNGPWSVVENPPAALGQVAASLSKQGQVDLLEGGKDSKLSLKTEVPAIYVVQGPAELVVFKGQPWFEPIANTNLLWVSNASGDVIMDADNNHYYLLVSGRWFTAASIDGPWSYVPSNDLPDEFRKIPANSPAAAVLTAVAGTPQAKEAVIANSIPQTAVIPRKGAPEFVPVIDGSPQLRPIEGTPLQYVWNSPDAIIEIAPGSFYALRNGVWFAATTLAGPWAVATSVPQVIYTIPPSSPLHYVTYVNIYWVSPDAVEFGYTPGYMGTVVASDGVVVYGTGYSYPAYVGTTVYYAPPVTYGYAVYPAYDVAAGAMFGFAMGVATASLLAPAPAWGPIYYNNYYGWGWHGYYPYGPYHGCCYNTGYENVYGHYGSTTYSGYRNYGYNPYTGNVGQTGQYHTYNPTTGVSSNIHSYSGYNAYTGTEAAGYNRQLHNDYTGTSGDVDRNAAYNPYTGNFDRSGSGSAYNPNTGASASVQHTSQGNVYSGYSSGQTTATVTNKSGQTNTYEAGHNGNNVYAGSDGNVYRNTGDGWQKNTSSGWQTMGSSYNSDLDRYSQSRSYGENRYNSFSNRGFYGGGGGGSFARFRRF